MTDSKISEAGRRGPPDPAQQHLRAQKRVWSDSATALIAKLIAFKRGLNGRGEPRAGLPPSKIEHPLPNEIPSYLDGIVTDFAALVDGAEAIVQEQSHYSQVRRKPQPKQAPQMPMAADDGLLVAEASWMGSRLWARTFGLSGKGKEHLVTMIDNAAEIKNSLEDLENILTSSNQNAIATAVNAAGTLGFSSISSFEKALMKLYELYPKNEEGEKPPAREPKPVSTEMALPPAKETPKEVPAPAQAPASEPELTLEQAQVNFFDTERKFALLKKDISKGNKIIETAKTEANNQAATDQTGCWAETAKALNNISGSIFSSAFEITKSNNAAKRSDDINALVASINKMNAFFDVYLKLILMCSATLGMDVKFTAATFDGFDQMSGMLTQKKQAGVKSYLKKRWMKFVNTIISDKIDTVKLQVLDSIEVANDQVNVLLNALETPGADITEIKIRVSAACKALSDVYVGLMTLAELHNTDYDQEKVNGKKRTVLFQIKQNSITKLKKMVNLLQTHVAKPKES